MATVKEDAIKIIQGLDDDSSMDDIHYHLYVKQKVEHGLEALKEGRHITYVYQLFKKTTAKTVL